ncbi:hypothetical protein A8L34_27895 [Bacillus sp. FJAT-27264]|uniref:hypothetical protein n=1 Tax=Paenibacillus sp. (strain DSM 101736 / FJAT-27264) TaxID=1850362 RepID=UPI000807DB07|nr:hypothetical protein [Bacillus sp. FJAT-27264]OBZ15872.1 hypothetical protein A8L34_27895 [Bacillus sp. FJAT-27264]
MIDWFSQLVSIDNFNLQDYESSWWEIVIGIISLGVLFVFLGTMIVALFHLVMIQLSVFKMLFEGWLNLFKNKKKHTN